MNCSRLPETHPPPPARRIAPESPLLQCFLGGECGGANTSSPAPLVTVIRLVCILVLPFYLSEGQSCHQTILSRLFMAAEILADRCSCVAVPYSMLCIVGWAGSSTGVNCRYPQGRLASHMEYCPKIQCHMLGGHRLLTWSPCIHWLRHRVLSFQNMARRSKTG